MMAYFKSKIGTNKIVTSDFTHKIGAHQFVCTHFKTKISINGSVYAYFFCNIGLKEILCNKSAYFFATMSVSVGCKDGLDSTTQGAAIVKRGLKVAALLPLRFSATFKTESAWTVKASNCC